MVSGQARVEAGERGRSVYVWGVTHEVPEVWGMDVVQGTFLPAGDPRRAEALCVLGPKLKRELFGDENAVGDFVRGRRLAPARDWRDGAQGQRARASTSTTRSGCRRPRPCGCSTSSSSRRSTPRSRARPRAVGW
jgi:hypothetical protein